MRQEDTNDPEAVALGALGWTLAEESRAQRLLALTGLSPDELRTRLDDPSALAAVLHFLEAHEPDLIACAEALDTTATTLIRARQELGQ